MLTIIALLCHTLILNDLPVKSCHEEVAARDLPMQACVFAQAGIAQWQSTSKYRPEDGWTVEGYKCAMGSDYVLKDGRA